MFRVAEYQTIPDDTAGVTTLPATADRYLGTGFMQQTVMGVRHVDDMDDRVTYEASISGDGPQAFSIGLKADGDGVSPNALSGGSLFKSIAYGSPADTGPDDGRPRVGFPLPHESDSVYASRTGDMAGDTVNEPIGYILAPDVYLVPEKPIQEPSRLSEHPAEVQHAMPWDTVMGAWPWIGTKVSLQRPVAAAPMTFDTPLVNPIPSPTGTSNADLESQYNVYPQPLTFRTPPEPWDTANDGQYVDGG